MANKSAADRHTPEFKSAAAARVAAGESVSGVARDIGVLRQQLQRWLAAKPPPPIEKPAEPPRGPRGPGGGYTEEFKRSVLDRARGDITLDALAIETGVERKTIIKWRLEADEPRKKRAFTKEEKLAAIARVERGEAKVRVAHAIGVNRVQFQKWFSAYREGRLGKTS